MEQNSLRPQSEDNTPVWVKTEGNKTHGRIITQADTPRSYIVDTPSRECRRNIDQLLPIQTATEDPIETTRDEIPPENTTHLPIRTRSQTGTTVQPPDRYQPTF